ncbi:hypothetical protein [Amycolatopsis sp. NPDC051061]|uniref:hypothetical protein n=1 Tax=Amycolatopsis sp. NPDC051061 TaxID=3155042 RepID=UPI00342432BE
MGRQGNIEPAESHSVETDPVARNGSVTYAMRGWPTPLGVTLTTSSARLFDRNGTCVAPEAAARLEELATKVLHGCTQADLASL